MSDTKQELFTRFGRLDTWVVGIQYYDGAKGLDAAEVFFDREPDNPFDPNAVAVFTRDGRQIGHLPRYDAAYFSPLMADGVVALKGQTGISERTDRLPLLLQVYATSKVSEILVRDARNDWRAIYHNLLIAVWERLGDYSSATLEEFRNRFRPLAHDQKLYPKTQFIYRMLKAHIAELENLEKNRIREQVLSAVKEMRFGRLMGWPEMTVIPLHTDASLAAQPANDNATNASLAFRDSCRPELLRLLPSRCPYPIGARGAVVLVHGKWFSLDWFDTPECAQVYWYPIILAGVEQAMNEEREKVVGVARTVEEIRAQILETLGQTDYSFTGAEENGNGCRIDIRVGEYVGNAVFMGAILSHLRVREGESEILCASPKVDRKSR